ncbi:MAG TPA: peptidyl-prolyl cis-trans isomerase [Clostridia bacterium]|nr:peptidyl-prolyl cis-trans isomerase [Clostridia bacterium]
MSTRRLVLLAALACSSFVTAQTAPPSTAPPAKASAARAQEAPAQKPPAKTGSAPLPKAVVPPDAPVITVTGSCDPSTAAKQAGGCRQVVTRAEFERLTKAAGPNVNDVQMRNFAQNLGRLVLYSNEAKRLGLDKNAEVQELIRFMTLQLMAQELGRHLQEQASHAKPGEVETYYRENLPKFEEATLERIIVPRRTASKEQPVDEEDEKAHAQKVRDRWVAGEDPEKLQKEAFERSATTVQQPPVKVGARRRGSLPVAQESVFDLKAGEVSQPFSDPSAFFIYKVEQKGVAPLEKATEEIQKALTARRLEAEVERLDKTGKTELNNAYFDALEPASPAPTRRPAEAKPEPTPQTGAQEPR